jgi:hypothetical protein
MTDSQSWPLSLPGFRDLAEKGAYSAKETYNEEDVGEITKYAAEVSRAVLFRSRNSLTFWRHLPARNRCGRRNGHARTYR